MGSDLAVGYVPCQRLPIGISRGTRSRRLKLAGMREKAARREGLLLSYRKTTARQALPWQSADLHALQTKQPRQFPDFFRNVADANRAVVSGRVRVPRFDELPGTDREAVPAVRISDFEDRAGDRFPLSDQQLQAVRHLDHRKQS